MDHQLRDWTAPHGERRAAWIVAAVCIVLIIASFLWPRLDSSDRDRPTGDVTAERTAQTGNATSRENSIRKFAIPAPKKEAKRPASHKPAPPPAKEGFYVQAGAFKEIGRARALARKLSTDWQTDIILLPGGLHAVRLGPYPSAAKAATARSELVARAKIKGFIVSQ